MLEKVTLARQKKEKLIRGKSGGDDPKLKSDSTVRIFSKKMRAYRAECGSIGARANAFSHSPEQQIFFVEGSLVQG